MFFEQAKPKSLHKSQYFLPQWMDVDSVAIYLCIGPDHLFAIHVHVTFQSTFQKYRLVSKTLLKPRQRVPPVNLVES